MHLLNHILGSMTHNPLDIRHDLYSLKLFQGKFSICTLNVPNCTIFNIFQGSTLLDTHSKCVAVLPFLFYNKLNSTMQSFRHTSELTKLHHLSFFFGGGGGEDALNSPTKPVVAKLSFLFLYLCNSIICEIFKEKINACMLQNALSY